MRWTQAESIFDDMPSFVFFADPPQKSSQLQEKCYIRWIVFCGRNHVVDSSFKRVWLYRLNCTDLAREKRIS